MAAEILTAAIFVFLRRRLQASYLDVLRTFQIACQGLLRVPGPPKGMTKGVRTRTALGSRTELIFSQRKSQLLSERHRFYR